MNLTAISWAVGWRYKNSTCAERLPLVFSITDPDFQVH